MTWLFRELENGEPERDPRETEFFRLSDPSDALVREFIQNSLDARRKNTEKIKVRFTFSSVKLTEPATYFIDELMKHVKACQFSASDIDSPQSNLEYLIVEDFGTTGLDGDTGRNNLRPQKGVSNFFDFWWREGISGKKEIKAGRWGLGKITFHISSKIRTFWGYTVRDGDERFRELLMGKALLKTHYINSKGYKYYGYFADKNYEPLSDNTPDGKAIIDDFKRNFSIDRRYDEQGLSLVIPLPYNEITFDSIKKSTIINYLFPLIKGILEVEIVDRRLGKPYFLNSNTVGEAASWNWENTKWSDFNVQELFRFVLVAASTKASIKITRTEGSSEITEKSFSDDYNEVKQCFNKGEFLSFDVLLHINMKKLDGAEKSSIFSIDYPSNNQMPPHFTIYLQKFSNLKKVEEFWIRSGIWISDVQSMEAKPVRAMIIIDDKTVSTFLGDAENPAHTEWKENTEGFKEKYENAASNLRFIRKSVSQIVSILNETSSGIRKDFFNDVFFVPKPTGIRENKDITKKPEFELKDKNCQRFRIDYVESGFKISFNRPIFERKSINIPLGIIVKTAYDTRKGNPFKKYEPYDFSFDDDNNNLLKISPNGCTIFGKSKNMIGIKISSIDFNLEVKGFDIARDVIVNIEDDTSGGDLGLIVA